MRSGDRPAVSRRSALKAAAALVATGAGAALPNAATKPVSAAELRPGDPLYHFDQYEAIVNRPLTVRQIFEWPNINNSELYANAVNALNAWQFAYDVPPDQIQVVVQAYASATVATFDDYIWNTYSIGQTLQYRDSQGNPASTNPFFHSAIPADQVATPPTDQSDPYYSDGSIEGLQRRGTLFLCCNNSLRGAASSAYQSGRNPNNLSLDDIVSDMQQHLIPGALLVPAGSAEIARLQDKGYRLVVDG
jgi:intracellular sulfur oxidation DsrE/DsrF family protein